MTVARGGIVTRVTAAGSGRVITVMGRGAGIAAGNRAVGNTLAIVEMIIGLAREASILIKAGSTLVKGSMTGLTGVTIRKKANFTRGTGRVAGAGSTVGDGRVAGYTLTGLIGEISGSAAVYRAGIRRAAG